MTPLEEIETKIRKLCPELQELSFGCMVETRFFGTKRLHLSWEKQDKSFIKLEDGRVLDVIEILWHTITLATVLRAIKEANIGYVLVSYNGLFHKRIDSHQYIELCKWNLCKDNLNKQSEETIAFLNSVIK